MRLAVYRAVEMHTGGYTYAIHRAQQCCQLRHLCDLVLIRCNKRRSVSFTLRKLYRAASHQSRFSTAALGRLVQAVCRPGALCRSSVWYRSRDLTIFSKSLTLSSIAASSVTWSAPARECLHRSDHIIIIIRGCDSRKETIVQHSIKRDRSTL